MNESGGNGVGVSDEETIEAMQLLGKEGLFIEPSGVVAIAGVRRLVAEGKVNSEERVVCVLTGSGFKELMANGRILPFATQSSPFHRGGTIK